MLAVKWPLFFLDVREFIFLSCVSPSFSIDAAAVALRAYILVKSRIVAAVCNMWNEYGE